MRKSDESDAGDVAVYQDISNATAGPSGKMGEIQLITQVLPMCIRLNHCPLLYKS